MKELSEQFRNMKFPSNETYNPTSSRPESTPVKFSSSDLFLIQENDNYTETFSHSWGLPQNTRTNSTIPSKPKKQIPRPKVAKFLP